MKDKESIWKKNEYLIWGNFWQGPLFNSCWTNNTLFKQTKH